MNFDLVGLLFGDKPQVKARSAQSRSDKLSFLKEITPEQMKTYTPDQIATILKQREHVSFSLSPFIVLSHAAQLLDVVDKEYQAACREKRISSAAIYAGIRPPPGFGFSEKPWVPDYTEECQVRCCHACRPLLEARSYLSLNGILEGDIPLTAATGFGFHYTGARPLVDADVVKKIGCRAVPWVGFPISCRLTVKILI